MDDHDTSYRLLFSHAEMVRDLLTGFVPESWIAELDLNSLEKMNGSYVSDDLRSRHNDAIWRVRWGQEWIYIYLLLEFQSTVDRFMPVRILTYTGLLYQYLVRRQELDNSRKLPPVLPIVLYNGAARWRAPTRVSGLIQPGPEALAEFQPDQALLLIDEGAFDMDELAPLSNLVAALFRLEHHRSLAEVPDILALLIDWLSEPGQEDLRRPPRWGGGNGNVWHGRPKRGNVSRFSGKRGDVLRNRRPERGDVGWTDLFGTGHLVSKLSSLS